MNKWSKTIDYNGISWCFWGDYDSYEKIYDELVKNKNIDHLTDDELEGLLKWNPFRIVINHHTVWIAYVARDGSGDYIWSNFKADNNNNFTAIELLLKSHNYFVKDKTPTNHNFLEGIDFVKEHKDGSPMYYLSCGS